MTACKYCDGHGRVDDRGFALRGQPFFCDQACPNCSGGPTTMCSAARTKAAEALARARALTVEECVYWLAVVQARALSAAHGWIGRSEAKGAIRQVLDLNVLGLQNRARQAIIKARYARPRATRLYDEALTVWALCRAAARAVERERAAGRQRG